MQVRAAAPGVQVRSAGARDLDRAAALASLLFADQAAEGARFSIGPGREAELRDLLAAVLGDARRRLWVAEAADGNLLGFAVASVVGRPGPFSERERGAIDWLFVRAEARRGGTGRALVDAGLAWLSERGLARVEVEVSRGNQAGRAFWQALGFLPSMDVLDRPL